MPVPGLDLDAVSAGISQGFTIPATSYTDPAIALELERIFDHSWQYVGHAARLAEEGDYVTGLAGRIGVVVVRDSGGELRGYVNVCPHRGHEVAEGCGRRRTLQCRYHGWTYGLDGRLRAAPRADRVPGVDLSSVALRPVQVGTWGPLVFVNADLTAPPLAAGLGELPALAASRGLRLEDHPPRARREWPIAANWKVTLDNNTECYHCATIHPGFAAGYHVDADSYEVTTFDRSFSHRSPARRGGPDFHLYYVWPNFMLSARGNDHYYVYVYRPVAAAQTRRGVRGRGPARSDGGGLGGVRERPARPYLGDARTRAAPRRRGGAAAPVPAALGGVAPLIGMRPRTMPA